MAFFLLNNKRFFSRRFANVTSVTSRCRVGRLSMKRVRVCVCVVLSSAKRIQRTLSYITIITSASNVERDR